MDSFELNKIAGAVLGTALLVMALSIVSEAIYEPHELETASYVIEVPEEAAGGEPGGGEPEVAPIAVRLQTADVAAGESSARKCAACHTLAKGEPAKVGPNLYGVVGNHAAHVEGFDFSDAMEAKAAEGMQWTFENLDHFLTDPRGFIPGTAMSFAGLKRPDERANVIAYLRTLSDSPVPLPEPPPPAEVSAEGQPATQGAPPPAEEAAPQGAAPQEAAPAGQEAPATEAAPAQGEATPATETAPQTEAPATEAAPQQGAPAAAPSPDATPAPPPGPQSAPSATSPSTPDAQPPAPGSNAPEAAPPGSVGTETELPLQP